MVGNGLVVALNEQDEDVLFYTVKMYSFSIGFCTNTQKKTSARKRGPFGIEFNMPYAS